MTNIDITNIDWQRVCLNLRSRYKPLSAIGREIKCGPQHLLNIIKGQTQQPKFNAGIRLLDLHLKHCPDQHNKQIEKGWLRG